MVLGNLVGDGIVHHLVEDFAEIVVSAASFRENRQMDQIGLVGYDVQHRVLGGKLSLLLV